MTEKNCKWKRIKWNKDPQSPCEILQVNSDKKEKKNREILQTTNSNKKIEDA